jgi:hypothetical protein
MALVLKDRVKETTTTTGTGSYVLAGAATGFQSFTDALADGDTTYYAVEDGTDWETGLGTWTESTTTLARTTVYESSNSGNAVDWGAGSKDIFITQPATRVGNLPVYATSSDLPSVSQSGDLAFVSGNDRLYLFNGSGWYNIALVNQTPTVSGNSATYTLATDGTATTVTLTGTDPEGFDLTWSATTSGDTGIATVTNSANVFTITPVTSGNGGTLTVTFRASDGINIGTASSEFSLVFVAAAWPSVHVSIGTSSTNSLANDTFIDRSTNSNTATGSGSLTQSAFHPYLDNWSMLCEAAGGTSGGGLDFGNDSTFALGTGDFTIEYWANLTSNAGPPLDWRANQSNGVYPLLSYTGSQFTYNVNGTTYITSSAQDTNTWHHVALVRNSGTTTMYINGTSEGSFSDSLNLLIGQARVGLNAFSGGSDLDGYISNVRVVKGTAVYTSAFTPPTEKLTAISGTILLTCQDNRFKDNSTNDWTPTVSNSPKISSISPFGQDSVYDVGENKGSLHKPTTTNWKVSALSSNLDLSGDFTIEMWWYPDIPSSGPPTNQYIIDFGSSPRLSIWWSWNDSRSIDYAFWAYTTNYQTFSSSANNIYPDNAWTHLAFVRTTSDNTVRLYANGVFQGSTQVSFSGDPTGDPFNIGNPNGGNSTLPSYWSDVKITASAKYSSDFTPPTSPLGNTNAGLYFPFDNAGIFDRTGNNTFTLNGKNTSTTQTKYGDTSVSFISDSAGMQIEYQPWMNFINGDFTWEAWVYLTSGDGGTLWSFGYDASNRFDFGWQGTSGIRLLIVNGGTSNTVFTSSDSVSTYQNAGWVHIALVRSGDTYTLYMDGSSSTSGTSSLTIPLDTTDGWQLGAREFSADYSGGTANDAFDGYMEDIQFVSKAKYSANFTPPSQLQGRTYQKESS